jgi:hypothetical protein
LRAKIQTRHHTRDALLTNVTIAVPVQGWKLITAAGLRLLWLTDASLASEPERVLTG